MSEMFPNHPKSGFYYSDKGGMVAPYEAPTQEDIENTTSRVNVPTESPMWNETIIEMTPTTGAATGYDSSLEGH